MTRLNLRQSLLRLAQNQSWTYSSLSSRYPPQSPRLRPIKRTRGQDPFAAPPPPSSFPSWSFEARDYWKFEVLYESKRSRARVGRIVTPHGVVETPGFVPVATNGALKTICHTQADAAGCQLMFCNTYHLMLQPGTDTIQRMGGLHKFMNRQRPLITDSGGFQIFSLAHGSVHAEVEGGGMLSTPAHWGTSMANGEDDGKKVDASAPKRPGDQGGHGSVLRISEAGVKFRSYRDGSLLELSPESSVQAQKALGADMIVPLDELPPFHTSSERLRESVCMTHRWEARSLSAHLKDLRQQAMVGVVHGGLDRRLRRQSAEYISSLPFDSMAIGGSIGTNHTDLMDVLGFVLPLLPRHRPVHILGVADEPAVRGAVPLGADTFDSCFATRLARHGTIFTRRGGLKIRQKAYLHDSGPLDAECQCHTCLNYSRAYLHHLHRAREPTAGMLMTVHNVHYMNDLMASMREAIFEGRI